MNVILRIKEQAVLISLLRREIARIEGKELAFKIQKTMPPYIYDRRFKTQLVEPTKEEIKTKNICKKILDSFILEGEK